jgi:hypothetical protein
MKFLTDSALHRLQEAADLPDLSGTRYRFLDKLGQGGMSGVFRVEDTTLGREVALKVISVPDPGGLLAARLERGSTHHRPVRTSRRAPYRNLSRGGAGDARLHVAGAGCRRHDAGSAG